MESLPRHPQERLKRDDVQLRNVKQPGYLDSTSSDCNFLSGEFENLASGDLPTEAGS